MRLLHHAIKNLRIAKKKNYEKAHISAYAHLEVAKFFLHCSHPHTLSWKRIHNLIEYYANAIDKDSND